jgi:two-component sensor histidine kinase/PAS domain-containing protein
VERREVLFESRPVGRLELHFTERLVDERMRSESIFIAVVVLLLDGILGLFLLLVLRSTVFRPLARIERWAAALERGEEPPANWGGPPERGEIASLRASIERMVGIIMAKEREYRSLFDYSPVSIWELDFSPVREAFGGTPPPDGAFGPEEAAAVLPLVKVKSVNPITLEWLGVDSLADLPFGLSPFLEGDAIGVFADEVRSLLSRSPGASGECRVGMPWGDDRMYAIRFATIAGHEDDWSRILLTAADITERKNAEERLVSALDEKSVLLRELFHRTRNSLQIVSSLIALREAGADERSRRELRGIRNRIDTMAIAQDALFECGDLNSMDLGKYVRELASMLSREYGEAIGRIRMDVRTDSVSGSIDLAAPLGLIVCELVSNAFAHAFPNGRAGTLSVALRKRGRSTLELSIADDGVGPPDGFDPVREAGLGLTTVRELGESQLDGALSFNLGSGFSATLSFRLSDIASRV